MTKIQKNVNLKKTSIVEKTEQIARPGDIIACLRRRKAVQAGDFAKKLGIGFSYLSLIENNRKKPGLKLFRKIAIELKIPFEKFMLMFIRDKFPEGLEYDELFIKVEPIIKSMLDIMIPD